ncbi:hypothetical protein PHMEG_00023430 [Phytophthora megakarya]|uniref:Reverse transcriptase Ty1/copia-type domain-containing protein n=1 Tax=Phytophthora megakarya TaxID=4795 RepID=A0A225VIR1_9STRA|nr:hypothetical protein PHMEG_00023430 [Phytophthora megakarya]
MFMDANADSYVNTRGEGDDECILCRCVDDLPIATNDTIIIQSVKAAMPKKLLSKDLGRAHIILGIETYYNMGANTLSICQQIYVDSGIKKVGHEIAKSCLVALEYDGRSQGSDKSKLSRELTNPGMRPWDAGIKVMRIMLKTKDGDITYVHLLETELRAPSNADRTGNRNK